MKRGESRRARSGPGRQRDHERAAATVLRLEPDPAAVRVHDLLRDRESEPRAAAVAPTGGVHAAEALEDPAPHRVRDPGSGVADGEPRLPAVPPRAPAHLA